MLEESFQKDWETTQLSRLKEIYEEEIEKIRTSGFIPLLKKERVEIQLLPVMNNTVGSYTLFLAIAILDSLIRKENLKEKMPFFDTSNNHLSLSFAYLCQKLEIPFYAVVSNTTPPVQMNLFREYGGKVVSCIPQSEKQVAENMAKTGFLWKGNDYDLKLLNPGYNWLKDLLGDILKKENDSWIMIPSDSKSTLFWASQSLKNNMDKKPFLLAGGEDSSLFSSPPFGKKPRPSSIFQAGPESDSGPFNFVKNGFKVPEPCAIAASDWLKHKNGMGLDQQSSESLYAAFYITNEEASKSETREIIVLALTDEKKLGEPLCFADKAPEKIYKKQVESFCESEQAIWLPTPQAITPYFPPQFSVDETHQKQFGL